MLSRPRAAKLRRRVAGSHVAERRVTVVRSGGGRHDHHSDVHDGQRRKRAGQRITAESGPSSSMGADMPDAGLSRSISGASLKECYHKAGARSRRLTLPPIDDCNRDAKRISEAVLQMGRTTPSLLGKAELPMQQLLKQLPTIRATFRHRSKPQELDEPKYAEEIADCVEIEERLRRLIYRHGQRRVDWTDVAEVICGCGTDAWRRGDRFPKAVTPDAPLTVLTQLVLARLGIRKSVEQVSVALRGRRGQWGSLRRLRIRLRQG